jgi:NAD(P)-dependent dehydrogenase (short-subunit alcohol dehydrogenase family)
MLSVLSWLHAPVSGAYSAAKAAEWAMTDALRQELAPRGIHVTAVHVGYMDTDMAAFAPADQKTDPAIVAELALDGLLAGEPEVLADDLTRATKAQLSGTPERSLTRSPAPLSRRSSTSMVSGSQMPPKC